MIALQSALPESVIKRLIAIVLYFSMDTLVSPSSHLLRV